MHLHVMQRDPASGADVEVGLCRYPLGGFVAAGATDPLRYDLALLADRASEARSPLRAVSRQDLKVLNTQGQSVGTLTMTLRGQAALASAHARAAAAERALEVRLESARVTSAAARDKLKLLGKKSTLGCSVDVLGAHVDQAPRGSVDATSGVAKLPFEKRYSLARGGPLRAAMVKALASEDESDSEVRRGAASTTR